MTKQKKYCRIVRIERISIERTLATKNLLGALPVNF